MTNSDLIRAQIDIQKSKVKIPIKSTQISGRVVRYTHVQMVRVGLQLEKVVQVLSVSLTVKSGQAFPDRINFKVDYCDVDFIIRFNNLLFG